ncbi:dTDP-glucose 4,6-dehydratase [Bradyrhizobium archetypum]|uniref:dTDP-glucose 4,6-dehydratase n=1 Tax=Bradyrhizobium archetypum TaxID=2721160 RepID=A0A7Y4HAZ0_9BRAD|nr:dTDP-glucose 4,6-dehydratase [Bradyrhizobium archetypum]NOJ50678.1 dTDP-glucose 4,6-dehydratase [Bradyrhizobium archetypum]
MRFLITGGCGFIGSAAVRYLVQAGHQVLNIDKLTYAGDSRTVAAVADFPNYRFEKRDILDRDDIAVLFQRFAPQAVWHFAAETHVDRSIEDPGKFIDTNVTGTFAMLQCALQFWSNLNLVEQSAFRFIHISTDEVYGSLGDQGLFNETTAYRPNSPYAASKAGADHLVRAWYATFGLPTIISNCSNNYGPFQNREKLIPTIIRKAIAGQPIPIYGQGQNVRDWLYVNDHVAAIAAICTKGTVGSNYNIGGLCQVSNIALATEVCKLLDERRPRRDGQGYAQLIQFVADRPGHDYRYAIDSTKARQELGWLPAESLQTGLSKTVDWYLEHMDWTLDDLNADDRLGLRLSVAQSTQGRS